MSLGLYRKQSSGVSDTAIPFLLSTSTEMRFDEKDGTTCTGSPLMVPLPVELTILPSATSMSLVIVGLKSSTKVLLVTKIWVAAESRLPVRKLVRSVGGCRGGWLMRPVLGAKTTRAARAEKNSSSSSKSRLVGVISVATFALAFEASFAALASAWALRWAAFLSGCLEKHSSSVWLGLEQ